MNSSFGWFPSLAPVTSVRRARGRPRVRACGAPFGCSIGLLSPLVARRYDRLQRRIIGCSALCKLIRLQFIARDFVSSSASAHLSVSTPCRAARAAHPSGPLPTRSPAGAAMGMRAHARTHACAHPQIGTHAPALAISISGMRSFFWRCYGGPSRRRRC